MNFKNKGGDVGGELKGCVPNTSDLVQKKRKKRAQILLNVEIC